MPEFKVLGDRTIVKPVPRDTITASGIFIPETAKHKEKTAEGFVVAVGSERNDVAVGDVVLHEFYAGSEMEVDGEIYISLARDEVLAIIG